MKKSFALRSAILERRAVVVPGCHDALSAKVIESSGFEAIQVSGFGVAASLLGVPDVGLVQMKDVLDITWNIAQVVRIPVMADVDTGVGVRGARGASAVRASSLCEAAPQGCEHERRHASRTWGETSSSEPHVRSPE